MYGQSLWRMKLFLSMYGREPKHDMVIGSNLLCNMGMKFYFGDKILDWDDDEIPLKADGAIQDRDLCQMLYSMYTNAPILQ